jgi:transcriptional regulator with XRE-family HTH domain
MRASDTVSDSPAAMSLSDSVAAEIRAEMGRQQLRNVALAARMGENEVWVSRKVRGLSPITLTELERFARALDVPITNLLTVARTPKGGSLQLTRPASTIRRTAKVRIGRGTPNLAERPRTQSIEWPDREQATAGGTARPRRTSQPASRGGAR